MSRPARPLFAALAALAVVLAACGSSGSKSSASGSSSTSGSAAPGAQAFCDAYGEFEKLDLNTNPNTPDETKQLIDQELAAFSTAVAAAPDAIKADATAALNDVKAGFAVIQKYGYDIDAAVRSGSSDEVETLNKLASAPTSGTSSAKVLDFVRASCPNVQLPSQQTDQSQFSVVGSTVN